MLVEAHSKRSAWNRSSSVSGLSKALWKPVKWEFENTISRLEKAVDEVIDEADLAEK